MSEHIPRTLNQIHPIEQIDEFLVVERVFSEDAELPSAGLANIHAEVPTSRLIRRRFCVRARFSKNAELTWPSFQNFVSLDTSGKTKTRVGPT